MQAQLEAAGIRVWRDTSDISPGQDWRAAIRGAIEGGALVFLACFSQNSSARASSYQNEELALAVEQLRIRRPGLPWLIPVRLDDSDIPDIDIGGGRSLSSLQSVELFGERRAENGQRLVAAVLTILGMNEHALSTSETEQLDGQRAASIAATRIRERGTYVWLTENADDEAPYIGDIDVVAMSNRHELATMLKLVHLRADRPSLSSLEVRTRNDGTPLSKSSISAMLKGARFPRKAAMLALLRACGIRGNDLAPWRRAWNSWRRASTGIPELNSQALSVGIRG